MLFDVDGALKAEAERAWSLWYKSLCEDGMRRSRNRQCAHESIEELPPRFAEDYQ